MISEIIRITEAQNQRKADAEKQHRRYRFFYFLISLVAAISVFILFGVTEQHTLLIAVISAATGFGGGFGVGKLTGRQ